jgi:hypothetical protein
MIGLSTSGSISFGCALVAGRNRVPRPAAGKTAFRMVAIKRYFLKSDRFFDLSCLFRCQKMIETMASLKVNDRMNLWAKAIWNLSAVGIYCK